MSAAAVIMMLVAIVTVWGGLGLALVNIKRSPEEADELDPEPGSGPGFESGPEPAGAGPGGSTAGTAR